MHLPALALPQCSGSTRLRRLRASDLARFAHYRADPGLAKYQGWEPMSLQAAEAFLTEAAATAHLKPGAWIQLAIAKTTTDELVGDVGLFLSEDGAHAELGFTLDRSHHGQGHATRAAGLAVEQVFRLATVAQVRAVTDEMNHASVAVLRRAGFVQTGSRQAVFKARACVEALFVRSRGGA